jgi:hypothetical protein
MPATNKALLPQAPCAQSVPRMPDKLYCRANLELNISPTRDKGAYRAWGALESLILCRCGVSLGAAPITAAAESLSPLRARLQNAPIHPPGLPQAGLMSSLEPLLEGGIGLRLPSVSKVAQALQHVLV